MKKNLASLIVGVFFCLIALNAFALEAKDVIGTWGIDMTKSQSAPDGNTAGLMKTLTIKSDGTFEALYGTHGTWTITNGKMLITFANDYRTNLESTMDSDFLKFPAPAASTPTKYCYMKKSS